MHVFLSNVITLTDGNCKTLACKKYHERSSLENEVMYVLALRRQADRQAGRQAGRQTDKRSVEWVPFVIDLFGEWFFEDDFLKLLS